MLDRINTLRTTLEQSQAKRCVHADMAVLARRDITRAKRRKVQLLVASHLINKVAEETQNRFTLHLESLATLAIRAVLERKFSLKLNFKKERGKPVCYMEIREGRLVLDPRDDIGYGLADIISFALTVGMLVLRRPPVRKFLWLDEPMKNVGVGEILRRVGHMIREISRRLKFQIVVNTHDETLAEFGDRVYWLTHNGEYTEVE